MHETISLRRGTSLPSVGLGMWKVPGQVCPELIEQAVAAGYRHFDCACDYGNEQECGAGLRAACDRGSITRDQLWVTSKLWNTFHRPEHVESACRKTLSDLGLDYLDLYLIHFPISLAYVSPQQRYPPGWVHEPEAAQPQMQFDNVSLAHTWQAMLNLREQGLVKAVGVCNFNVVLLREIAAAVGEYPEVLQVESHPLLVQSKLLRFCQQNQIAYTAFSPLGALSYHEIGMADRNDSLLQNPVITEIAAGVGRSPAQVLLRWGVQRGTAVIPKTSRVDRLAENIALFDFELSPSQMNQINGLDQNRRYNDPGVFGEQAFGTFCPIYE